MQKHIVVLQGSMIFYTCNSNTSVIRIVQLADCYTAGSLAKAILEINARTAKEGTTVRVS